MALTLGPVGECVSPEQEAGSEEGDAAYVDDAHDAHPDQCYSVQCHTLSYPAIPCPTLPYPGHLQLMCYLYYCCCSLHDLLWCTQDRNTGEEFIFH